MIKKMIKKWFKNDIKLFMDTLSRNNNIDAITLVIISVFKFVLIAKDRMRLAIVIVIRC